MQRRSILSGIAGAPLAAAALSTGCSTQAGTPPREPVPALPREAQILFQGDSITDGGRQRDGDDQNHIFGQSYAFMLMGRLAADHPAMSWRFANRGISGNMVADLARRWDTDTLALKPDVLSILIGINETIALVMATDRPRVTPAQYEADYDALLTRTRTALPDVELVLAEPFALPHGATLAKWAAVKADVDQRRAAVARLAAKHGALLVPYQAAFDQAATLAPPGHWIWDGIHPTPAGHQLMADTWLKTVIAARR